MSLLCCKISHICCKHQVSTKRMFLLLQKVFPFPLIYIITLLNPLPVLIILLNPLPVLIILLNPLPVLVALQILQDILSFTRSFMINTRPLVGCLEKSDRKVKQFHVIPRIASSRLVGCSSIQCPNFNVWFCNVRNCHTTDIALTERLGSNGF